MRTKKKAIAKSKQRITSFAPVEEEIVLKLRAAGWIVIDWEFDDDSQRDICHFWGTSDLINCRDLARRERCEWRVEGCPYRHQLNPSGILYSWMRRQDQNFSSPGKKITQTRWRWRSSPVVPISGSNRQFERGPTWGGMDFCRAENLAAAAENVLGTVISEGEKLIAVLRANLARTTEPELRKRLSAVIANLEVRFELASDIRQERARARAERRESQGF